MKFVSTHPTQALSFEIDGQRYEVPVGGTVEMTDRHAVAVKLNGLPLEPAMEHLERITRPDTKPGKESPKESTSVTAEKTDPKRG